MSLLGAPTIIFSFSSMEYEKKTLLKQKAKSQIICSSWNFFLAVLLAEFEENLFLNWKQIDWPEMSMHLPATDLNSEMMQTLLSI